MAHYRCCNRCSKRAGALIWRKHGYGKRLPEQYCLKHLRVEILRMAPDELVSLMRPYYIGKKRRGA